MMDQQTQDPDWSEFVEVDPTGRYGRYNEILGKGASKIVYKAFDEYEGIEVAWNQVKLYDFLQSPEELERLYCEIHLLKTLKHKNIMKFYSSWVDTSKRNINFVTEMFTSGTLRQYRQKHKRVNIRAVKHWCRQILKGLLYLHSHDPPIIHRDLKCDNIFINGNQGEVKIGDLGLAAILRKSHAAHCVGTPEFMAPEIYEEQYNELVDIYSFGMCILEMVTFEYPYCECTHPAQIYKKVSTGTMPESLYKVQDPEVRQFVEKCVATVSRRLPAKELLRDPFLQIEGSSLCSREDDVSELGLLTRQPSLSRSNSNDHLMSDWFSGEPSSETENGWEYDAIETEPHGIELFGSPEDEIFPNVDITIKGRKREEDGAIFLRLRMADQEDRIRNIYFSFDVEADTAISVATEMVGELDIMDYDVTSIAEMIDSEISSLVPDWKPGPGFEETPGFPPPTSICPNCESNDSSSTSLGHFLSSNNPGCNNFTGSHCSRVGCSAATTHGRFEEVTYQVDGSEKCMTQGAPELSSRADGLNMCSPASKGHSADLENERLNSFADRRSKSSSRRTISQILSGSTLNDPDAIEYERRNSFSSHARRSFAHSRSKSSSRRTISQLLSGSSSNDQSMMDILEGGYQYNPPDLPDVYENEIRHELRWLEVKYELEPPDCQNRQSEDRKRPPSPYLENEEYQVENGIPGSFILPPIHASNKEYLKSLHLERRLSSYLSCDDTEPTISTAGTSTVAVLDDRPYTSGRFNPVPERIRNCEPITKTSVESSFVAKNFYTGVLLPGCLPRAKSLSVDAVDS